MEEEKEVVAVTPPNEWADLITSDTHWVRTRPTIEERIEAKLDAIMRYWGIDLQ